MLNGDVVYGLLQLELLIDHVLRGTVSNIAYLVHSKWKYTVFTVFSPIVLMKGYRITLSLSLLYAKDSLDIFLSFDPILDRVEGSIVAQLPNLDVWAEPTF